MREAFLQFVWQQRLYTSLQPQGSFASETIEIIDPGILNEDAGADFFNAKIKIGDIIWAGDVEIHHKSKQWTEHNHQVNPIYETVILHIVLEYDREIKDTSGREIPTCTMSIPQSLLERAEALLSHADSLPCSQAILSMEQSNISEWLEQMSAERLESKADDINLLWHSCEKDWRETIYRRIMSYFGFNLNNAPMEQLARTLPIKNLLKHTDNPLQIEALLLGQSGLIAEIEEQGYRSLLEREYSFLAHKYQLSPINPKLWRKARTRPQNFPLRRLLQIASLFQISKALSLDFFLKVSSYKDLAPLFDQESLSQHCLKYIKDIPYMKGLSISSDALQMLFINVVIPLRLQASRILFKADLEGTTLDALKSTPAETNKITRQFTKLGIKLHNASESQACIHIYKAYCLQRKCLYCKLGRQILSKP